MGPRRVSIFGYTRHGYEWPKHGNEAGDESLSLRSTTTTTTNDERWGIRDGTKNPSACGYDWLSEGHNDLVFSWHLGLVDGPVWVALGLHVIKTHFSSLRDASGEALYAHKRLLEVGGY